MKEVGLSKTITSVTLISAILNNYVGDYDKVDILPEIFYTIIESVDDNS